MSEIKCPYCGAEDDDCVSDLWEYEGYDNESECASCEKPLIINAEVTVSYEAKRPECEDDNHSYGEWVRMDISQDTLEQWAKDPVMSKHVKEDKPYSYFSRDCQHCDDTDYSIHYELGVVLDQANIKSKYKD